MAVTYMAILKWRRWACTACVDEKEHNYLRVVSRTFGERIIHVEDALSEAGSFRAEIDNFVKSIRPACHRF